MRYAFGSSRTVRSRPATGLWASGAEEEPAAAMEKEMTDPTTGDGDRAAVWRDIDSGHAERPCRL